MLKIKINPTLKAYIDSLETEFDLIDDARKKQLEKLGQYIGEKTSAGKPARLTVICTHNSRRSHLGQLWLKAAADHYGVNEIAVFSGGTEATAFNHRAVEALRKAGFEIRKTDETDNPVYEIAAEAAAVALKMFSKKFDHPVNPESGFAAIMVCSEAEAACPLVPGAERRFSLMYDDPKHFDGMPEEATAYADRCRQIAREMFFAMRSAG